MITNTKRLTKILTSPIKNRADWIAIFLYSDFTQFCKRENTKSFYLNIKAIKESFQISNAVLRNKLKKLKQVGLIEVVGVGITGKNNTWEYDIKMSYQYNKKGVKNVNRYPQSYREINRNWQ